MNFENPLGLTSYLNVLEKYNFDFLKSYLTDLIFLKNYPHDEKKKTIFFNKKRISINSITLFTNILNNINFMNYRPLPFRRSLYSNIPRRLSDYHFVDFETTNLIKMSLHFALNFNLHQPQLLDDTICDVCVQNSSLEIYIHKFCMDNTAHSYPMA